MRKFLILFMLIPLFHTGFAQDTTFNRLVESFPGTLIITSMLSHEDFYYCLLLQVDTPNNQYQQYGILKLNSSFDVVDSSMIDVYRSVIFNYNGLGLDISPTDTTFIAAGLIKHQHPMGHRNDRGYLAKFNKNLDTLWTKEINHPDTAYADTCRTPWLVFTDVKVTPAGDHLISGNYNHQCQGDRNRLFIIKMDPGGEIIWWKFYPQFTHQDGLHGGIELASDGSGFYFWARANNQERKLYKLDYNGDIQWSIPVNLNPLIWSYYRLREYGDNIIVASTYSPQGGPLIPLLCVTSVNHKTQTINWEKNFPDIRVNSMILRYETIEIEITKSGNIAIGVTSMDLKPNLLLLNQNGDPLWNHKYAYENAPTYTDMEFNAMVLCDDGGFLLGGTLYDLDTDPFFWKAWLIKTDSNGMAPFVIVDVEEQEIVIKREPPVLYPVPATDRLNIRFQELLEDQLLIEVFNLSGQQVLQKQLPSFDTEYRIGVHDLPAGTYVIRLSTGQELLYNGKFVKR